MSEHKRCPECDQMIFVEEEFCDGCGYEFDGEDADYEEDED